MKAYYTCLVGCTKDTSTCRDSCAIKTLNTTLAEFNLKSFNYSNIEYLCDYEDLDCIFSYADDIDFSDEEVLNYQIC
jgi:hypothetical protein